jgi:hypothetical protein
MDPEIKTLIQALAQNRLREELASRKLTPRVAAAARQAYGEAMESRVADTAMAAAFVAASIYESLGDRVNYIRNFFNCLQVQFMLANTPQEYATVRERLLELVNLADDAKAPQLAFNAIVLASDSAYFAAKAANDDISWFLTTLRDLNTACQRAQGVQKDDTFAKFVDLIANTANIGMTRYFASNIQSEVDSLLSSIAGKVDDLVPAEFEFPGDPQQTSKIAAILAQFTDKYVH